VTPRYSMADRTALVSGASSGIGAHLAKLFGAAGANVVLGARRTDMTDAIANQITASGGNALAIPMDVTDEDSVIAAFDAAELEFGVVDSIIANAGVAAGGRSTDIPLKHVQRVVDTNFTGAYLTAREGAKRLIASGSREKENGRIVIIGSITSLLHGEGDSAYAALKAGVAHLGRNMAREWVRQGINVNTVHPGYIDTEINADWYETEGGKQQIAAFNRRRLTDLDALDDPVLFLSSDASKMVTGSEIIVDDGQWL